MPARGGVALAEHLWQRVPALKVLFMSGYAEGAEPPLESRHPFIRKPFRPAELYEKVQEILGGQ